MKQEIKVKIKIKSEIEYPSEKETFEEEFEGVFRCVSGSCSLTYRETQENGAKVFNTLSFASKAPRVLLKKRGSIKSEMFFDTKEICDTNYEIGDFRFPLNIKTSLVINRLNEFGGELVLIYLRVISKEQSKVTFHLTMTPVEEDE